MLPAFDASRRRWYESACARIDAARLQQLIVDLTNLHSPTGAERPACEFLARHLSEAGLDASYQAVLGESGNCVARLRGAGGGPAVMMYAPIDTHLDADPAQDLPWAGPRLRPDMLPVAQVRDDSVIGLGASNPKSMVAAVVEAVRCLIDAGTPLVGEVIAAFCGGGMPWMAHRRGGAGISSGVKHMLTHGTKADCAVILKTWDEVYYEHPGMVWLRITVWGSMSYAGIPRGSPQFRSSTVPAAKLILELEQWLTAYPERHQSRQVRPEGAISAIRAGWIDKLAFPSAATELYVDVRTSPDQSTSDLEREFDAFLTGVKARHPDIEATWETVASCVASRTDPDHWIVRSAVRAWEETHGQPYPGAPAMSGQTDAAAICALGVPIVRIGYPFGTDLPGEFADGLGGMGVAKISDLTTSIRQMIYIMVDTCTRTREELAGAPVPE